MKERIRMVNLIVSIYSEKEYLILFLLLFERLIGAYETSTAKIYMGSGTS
jgi:hypothetical protein